MVTRNQKVEPNSFKSIYSFIEANLSGLSWGCSNEEPLPADLQVLPRFIIENIYDLPPLMKQIEADSYFGQDIDLQL